MNRSDKRRQRKLAEKLVKNEARKKPGRGQLGRQQPLQSLDLALQHHNAGELTKAERIYQQILQSEPNQPDALNLLGVIAHQVGKHDSAVELITKAIDIKPDFAEAHSNLGNALQQLGRLDEAVAHLSKAIDIKPDLAEAHSNLGNALQDLGRLDEAIAHFSKAIDIKPDFVEAQYNLGNALKKLGQLDEAIAHFSKAIDIKPDFAEAHSNLGNTLQELGQLDEAIAHHRKAIDIEPDFAEAHSNLGNVLMHLGRLDEAIALHRKAIALKPDFADAYYNRGLTFLLMGDFPAGWADYEHRWDRKKAPPRMLNAPYPAWNGEDIRGKPIIVYEEQGLGDIIQFSRYLNLLSSLGADVTFLVRSSMHRLLQAVATNHRLTDKIPDGETFDFQCALMSLPSAFRTTLSAVPSDIPYLVPEAPLVANWQQRIGHQGLKIGICWQGNPASDVEFGRSAPLRCFHPIGAIPDVRLISLQKTHGLDQLTDLPAGMTVETLGDDFDSGADAFIDTAAIMSTLDLIITSDTSVAHLAGALGCPVWVVLKHVPDWRWMLDRSDSPWYPTMTLYRQDNRDDWGSVFDQVAVDVAQFNGATASEASVLLQIPGSIGELFDKITILEIKAARINDPEKVRHVAHELDLLRALEVQYRPLNDDQAHLIAELKCANEELWDIEDAIRVCERRHDFSADFISLARSVYNTNDRRAAIKKQINMLYGSDIVEEKSYAG